LAAFIVVAIIAAILLVTAVRSHAEPDQVPGGAGSIGESVRPGSWS
jgi:hypothetical protein